MIEFNAIEHLDIKGRGHVITVHNDRDYDRNKPSHLIGNTVLIDGSEYLVKGVESWALQTIHKGVPIGLLVIPSNKSDMAE